MDRIIKTKPTLWVPGKNMGFEMWGWLCGKKTYIAFGVKNCGLGSISGRKLYRLAKAIVKHYEEDNVHSQNKTA